jgi:hypothetical protein
MPGRVRLEQVAVSASIRCPGATTSGFANPCTQVGPRVYGAVRKALILLWEASDRVSGK